MNKSYSNYVSPNAQITIQDSHANVLGNQYFRLAEKIYTFVGLLFFTDALAFRSLFFSSEGLESSLSRSPIDSLIGLTRYSIYAFTIFVILARHKIVLPIVRKDIFIWGLILITLLSFTWSDFPRLTLRYGLFVCGTTLFGLYFTVRYSFQEQLNFLVWVFATITMMSLLFTLAFPGSGIEQGIHAGAWRGVFWHKNNLGRYMATGATLFVITALSSSKNKYIYWCFCALAVALLLLSTSKTALLLFLTALLLLPLCYLLRSNDLIFIPVFLTLFLLWCFISIWLIEKLEIVLAAFGRSMTLTGRTDIWMAVIEKIKERPLLGYGFDSFWFKNGQGADVWKKIGFVAAHSHNGFLDLSINIGLFGLCLFLLSFAFAYGRSIILVRRSKTAQGFWPLIFVIIHSPQLKKSQLYPYGVC